MSFKENDNKHKINLNNYEEYFLLYVDGELNKDEMKSVDDFVIIHPGLKSELDLLLSTRISPDELTIDKNELYSFSMDKLINEEQLLSFIDGELSKDEHKKIKEKIHSGSPIQKEYELLLKTKLDPSEIISYPNKEELYKRTRKAVPFSPWLRAAAVFILIAAGFIIYEKRSGSGNQHSIAITNAPSNNNTKPETTVPTQDNKHIIVPENVMKEDNHLAILHDNSTKKKAKQENTIGNPSNRKELAVKNNLPTDPVILVNNPTKEKIETTTSTPLIAYIPPTQTINKSPVTSALSQRTISSSVPTSDPDPGTTVATHSDRKGSFKSLLRKAARVIEKKTGIDPANDNDELLIGAVAVKLN